MRASGDTQALSAEARRKLSYPAGVVRLRLAFGAAAVLGAALAAAAPAAPPLPDLRAVPASRGHVVAVFDPGELAPLRIAIASGPTTEPNGSFRSANVRLDEAIGRLQPAGNGVRFRTARTLPAGVYWVEVSARPLDVDCLPLKPCSVRWSNALRLVVPARR
jgi:hypothetical protein